MSLTSSAGGTMPLPSLAWDFNGTNAPYIGTLGSTTLRGTVNYGPGKFNQSLDITNPSGTTSNSINFNFGTTYPVDTGFSQCMWFKCNDLSYLSSTQIVSVIYNAGSNLFRFQITVSGRLQFQFNDGFTNESINLPFIIVGTWYHLSAVIFNGELLIYVNGNFSASFSYVKSGITFNNMSLGLNTNGNSSSLTNGSFDDLRIFDQPLTSTQVQAIYRTQGMPSIAELRAVTYTNILSPTLYSFSSQIFSNAQATSNIGPTQIQLDATYPTLAPTYLTSNAGVQTWTVPVTGVYQIEAAGASGGTASSVPSGGGAAGRGVIVSCKGVFQQNQTLSIIVGQKGVSSVSQNTSNVAGGGGGGSFVLDFSNQYLYIAAGGGGGASCPGAGQTTSSAGFDAVYTTNATGGGGGTSGGTNGSGGTAIRSGTTGQAGGAGGGFYSDGQDGLAVANAGAGGKAVLRASSSQGGLSANVQNLTNSFGGFGCGGGGGGNLSIVINTGAGGAGGGGYSGGGGGIRNGRGGGGGGSFVPIGQKMSQLGYCTSNGYVSISYVSPLAEFKI
jgi:hypothetical protein